MTRQATESECNEQASKFELARFFPYQSRRTHAAVSACLANIYEKEYGLSTSEWRVMAILGRDNEYSSRMIVLLATIDKVAVSRAVTKLKKRGFIEQRPNPEDGRSMVLRLSSEGLDCYNKLVPRLLRAEELLLSGLSPAKRKTLDELLRHVESNAYRLIQN